ncbi:hypothetical protein L596_021687 [Steinernema carpocapsae]|uniref:Uncharacterized protein n=1 Tax=Steinernema carpocapsae TaxID=34508 RepID=A0A4U5MJU6_STECR|nr:hypothetical protein L596_021687 [Steinernema carpocapsae]
MPNFAPEPTTLSETTVTTSETASTTAEVAETKDSRRDESYGSARNEGKEKEASEEANGETENSVPSSEMTLQKCTERLMGSSARTFPKRIRFWLNAHSKEPNTVNEVLFSDVELLATSAGSSDATPNVFWDPFFALKHRFLSNSKKRAFHLVDLHWNKSEVVQNVSWNVALILKWPTGRTIL